MSIESILKEVESIKEDIEAAKQDRAELKGSLNEQIKALKAFGISTIGEAKKMIVTEGKKVEKYQETIERLYDKLKDEYEW